MLKFDIYPELALRNEDGSSQPMRQLLELLAAIGAEGNLNKACTRLEVSYRHAWGLVRDGSRLLGAPLVSSGRGQRAQLTALGEKLVWANKRIDARLTPVLESFASELETDLKNALQNPKATLRVRASHAFAIAALHALLQDKHQALDLRYVGSSEALAALARGACEIAGFHVPIGELESQVLHTYARWLNPREHVLVHMVVRRQGLIVAPGNPKHLASVADLAQRGIRFVNRQEGSGTRLLLGMLLEQAGMNPSRITGFDVAEYTHAAVAAYIASGMADAGMGVETAARQFKLGFVPLANERYFIACKQDMLDSAQVEMVLAGMRSPEFKRQLADLQGIDGIECGTVLSLAEAFPDFAFPKSRAGRG